MPPALSGNIPVIRLTTSSSTPYGQIPGAPRTPTISLPIKRFQPDAELYRIDVVEIAELSPLPEISYEEINADAESNDSLDMSGAEGKAPISLKQTEFPLKQFGKRMGQPNFSMFNKWKKVWVAGFLEMKHWSIILGQNNSKQLRDGSLHWKMAVAECLETFETWLPLENFDNAEWI